MARPRHLVVVIPGIAGSVLADPDGGELRYSLGPAGLARTVADPAALDIARPLVATDLVRDFVALPPLLTLSGYQRLDAHLTNRFADAVIRTYRPGQLDGHIDVLRFPYDFRQSIQTIAGCLDAAVAAALRSRERAADRPVIVVAHSLGGLVARFWLAVLGGWRWCEALITMGTPYRGAPKALDWLVNGAGTGVLRDPRMTRVIRGWPSAYELAPQYEAVWDDAEGKAIELTELPASMLARSRGLARYAPQFARMSADARAVHTRIQDGLAAIDPGQAPQLVAFFGRGHPTPNLLTLDEGRLRVSKSDPPWRGNTDWRGDGSVPMLCAIPHELGRRQDLWRVRSERHGDLGSLAAAIDQVGLYEGQPVPVRGGPLPARPWLGLDLDEFVPAGVPIAISATLLPAPLAGELALVSLSPLDGTPKLATHPQRLAQATTGDSIGDGQTWSGSLPAQPPGRYEVAVQVNGVPGTGSVAAAATVVVLDPADLDQAGAESEELPW